MARHGRSFPIKPHMNYPGMLGIYANRHWTQELPETFTLTDFLHTSPSQLILTESIALTAFLVKIPGRILQETFSLIDSMLRTLNGNKIITHWTKRTPPTSIWTPRIKP